VDLYDVLIFPGLWAESVLSRSPFAEKPEPVQKKLKAPNANLERLENLFVI